MARLVLFGLFADWSIRISSGATCLLETIRRPIGFSIPTCVRMPRSTSIATVGVLALVVHYNWVVLSSPSMLELDAMVDDKRLFLLRFREIRF